MTTFASTAPPMRFVDAAERYHRAYRRVASSKRVAYRAIQASASRDLDRIERRLQAPTAAGTASGRRASGGTELAQKFLEASSRSIGMSAGAVVLVAAGVYLGVVVGARCEPGNLHFRFGEGPAIDAWEGDRIVEVADFAEATSRWPAFASAALESGVRSAVGVPLWHVDKRGLVLFLWGPEPIETVPRSWGGSRTMIRATSARLGQLNRIATIARGLLLDHPDTLPAEFLARHIASAIDDTAVIHQASGVISARLSITPPAALDLLRFQAWADGRTLEELSAEYLHDQL